MITRPAGTARALARLVAARGGVPRLLPGLSLRAMPSAAVDVAWRQAQGAEVMVFTSPAAVRFALRHGPLRSRAYLLGVGRGTRDALRRAGHARAQAPARGEERSEGVLAHPLLREVRGRRVAVVTAPGGRDLITPSLRRRGARVERVDVYQRVAPRLTRRHADMVRQLRADAVLLVTSAQALDHLLELLPVDAAENLRERRIVVSSERLAAHARKAGFRRVRQARSPSAADVLDAAAWV